MNIYDFSVSTADGKQQSMEEYKDKIVLIVNTASKCGFTSQYEELQELYETYREKGVIILAFPCNQFMKQEPGSNLEIQQFCSLNYGVSFPVFGKINVRGKDAHPLFQYLVEQTPSLLGSGIKWNFTKFLVDRKGLIHKRYAPITSPRKIVGDIELLLKESY
ncbi:glutathione peroxidase [Pelosinus sp. UFO1]|uniref:glutathione peroxidase n=1 Tax=Pelosinus sp. UFO1 TaxID=484770 RepID=UPI0004D1E08C|nr:glutathione peroxidase [Pelosinus sp. UFO1]AIF49946.1 Peroxiredoxin [Pelosinus sp. UFO1]